MTGPEHYLEAKRLLDIASTTVPDDEPAQVAITRRAHVHATLALAAATALSGRGEGMSIVDSYAWDKVCGAARAGAR